MVSNALAMTRATPSIPQATPRRDGEGAKVPAIPSTAPTASPLEASTAKRLSSIGATPSARLALAITCRSAHWLHHGAERDHAHPRSHPQARHGLSTSPTLQPALAQRRVTDVAAVCTAGPSPSRSSSIFPLPGAHVGRCRGTGHALSLSQCRLEVGLGAGPLARGRRGDPCVHAHRVETPRHHAASLDQRLGSGME
jgi:hypothetical protein